jgi:hypothetical protein
VCGLMSTMVDTFRYRSKRSDQLLRERLVSAAAVVDDRKAALRIITGCRC